MAFKKGSAAAKAHMAKIRAAKISGVAPKKKSAAKKKVVKQTGVSVKKYDKMRQALPPGIRISKQTGNFYKEVRANRSDKGVLLGTKNEIQVLKNDIFNKYYNENQLLLYYNLQILNIKELTKNSANKDNKKSYLHTINFYKKIILETKKHLTELKKLL